ncbi:DUF1643 domain-containing protein [Nodosilinea sp. PGN35]|uniref:DUF1643 domain-containing protein n=1 Tax=Nodosilinea sp. PGN35 TaxID=3020489 RepID=UPI0023B305B0|nr:DUF1643 domain-containing protein [Nodosilinea sp. TSF1-S3]MDF0368857.1 DUF1643 domain-containing protein [Nodosilinea sp. TSF1-S3]
MLQLSAIERSATFDPTGRYRYSLGRRWSAAPTLAIIMLNPSQADSSVDDPTIRRCTGLAMGWGFGAIAVVNLFAYRSPHPKALRQADDPIGSENDAVLSETARQADQILLAWGNWGSWLGRDRTVLTLLTPHQTKCRCLGQNRTGQPRHPLYIPRHTPLQPWILQAPATPLPPHSPTPACRAPDTPRRPPQFPAQSQTNAPTRPPSAGWETCQK